MVVLPQQYFILVNFLCFSYAINLIGVGWDEDSFHSRVVGDFIGDSLLSILKVFILYNMAWDYDEKEYTKQAKADPVWYL